MSQGAIALRAADHGQTIVVNHEFNTYCHESQKSKRSDGRESAESAVAFVALFNMLSADNSSLGVLHIGSGGQFNWTSGVLIKLDCQSAALALRSMELFNSSLCSLHSLKADCAVTLEQSRQGWPDDHASQRHTTYTQWGNFVCQHLLIASRSNHFLAQAVESTATIRQHAQRAEALLKLTLLRPSRPYTTSARSMPPHSSNMGRSSFHVYFHGMP